MPKEIFWCFWNLKTDNFFAPDWSKKIWKKTPRKIRPPLEVSSNRPKIRPGPCLGGGGVIWISLLPMKTNRNAKNPAKRLVAFLCFFSWGFLVCFFSRIFHSSLFMSFPSLFWDLNLKTFCILDHVCLIATTFQGLKFSPQDLHLRSIKPWSALLKILGLFSNFEMPTQQPTWEETLDCICFGSYLLCWNAE